jgi:predicted amidohydrolase
MRRLAAFIVLAAAAVHTAHARQLRVAVVQMVIGPTVESNRDRIVGWVGKAAERGARVVVFPEGALSTRSDAPDGDVPGALASIREAARARKVWVVFGGWTWNERLKKNANWMKVISPAGDETFHYDKLWDVHDAPTPGVFRLDGVGGHAIICADRWLRGIEELPVQAGSQIAFELSNNFGEEWVSDFGWYWYVPRALRNNVWVILANSGNRTPGKADPGGNQTPRHGHSVIIAPDGSIKAGARDDLETMLVADLEIDQATRAEALARGSSPTLGEFWKAGVEFLGGRTAAPISPARKASPQAEITVAAAQFEESPRVEANIAAMVDLVGQAGRKGAELVAFPELAATAGARVSTGDALERLRGAARAARITVVAGMPFREVEEWRNSAYVIGPDGGVITRYDQISARPPFTPGKAAGAMWFEVKGVPAVATVGRDALWNEIAELAAVAGARLHVNISRERLSGSDDLLRRRQGGAAMSSFSTLTVMANSGGGSAIWDDLTGREETRAFLRNTPRPQIGDVKVYSIFSANLVVEAPAGPSLVTATGRIPGPNLHHPQRTANFHPAFGPWYLLGASWLMNGPKVEARR